MSDESTVLRSVPEGGYTIPEVDAAGQEIPHHHCLTAFVIVINEDGTVSATSNLAELAIVVPDEKGEPHTAKVTPSRQASFADMKHGCYLAIDDITGLETASRVMAQFIAMQQRMQAELVKKSTGLQVPGQPPTVVL